MSAFPVEENRRFSYSAATAMLPWIKVIVRDMVTLASVIADRKAVLEGLGRPNVPSSGDPYREELEASRASLRADAETLHGYVDELGKLGIVVRSLPLGVVDIPAVRQGRAVYLNWRHGEPELCFWRELEEDPEVRRDWQIASLSRFASLELEEDATQDDSSAPCSSSESPAPRN